MFFIDKKTFHEKQYILFTVVADVELCILGQKWWVEKKDVVFLARCSREREDGKECG